MEGIDAFCLGVKTQTLILCGQLYPSGLFTLCAVEKAVVECSSDLQDRAYYDLAVFYHWLVLDHSHHYDCDINNAIKTSYKPTTTY